MARSGARTDRLDLGPKHRPPVHQQLEPVILGRVVAAGNLDAAVDVEIMGRKIKHGGWTHGNLHDVGAAVGKAADQRHLELAAMQPPIAADRDSPRAFIARHRSEGSAEAVGIVFAQRVTDDPANVIFAQDGGIEVMGHCTLNCHCERNDAIQKKGFTPSRESILF